MAGFITTKTAELEKADWLKAKFDEASKYVDLDQLGIAPQCGFASTEEGNAITYDDQRANWICGSNRSSHLGQCLTSAPGPIELY